MPGTSNRYCPPSLKRLGESGNPYASPPGWPMRLRNSRVFCMLFMDGLSLRVKWSRGHCSSSLGLKQYIYFDASPKNEAFHALRNGLDNLRGEWQSPGQRHYGKGNKMTRELTEEEIKAKFQASYDSERKEHKKPNILVCGYTGSGKSSLIKAILGDVVPDAAIGTGKPQTMGYDHYEDADVSIWDSRGLEAGDTEDQFVAETKAFLEKRMADSNVDNHIHLVWYTIQLPGARVTPCDLHLIQRIFSPKNLIVVFTKCDGARGGQIEAMKKPILEAGVPAERIVCTSDLEGGAIGNKQLMELSFSMLPAAYQDAFELAQTVDKERRKNAILAKIKKAKAIIGTATTAASAAAAIPIPFSDAAVITPIQIGMIGGLAGLYGLNAKDIHALAMPLVAQAVGIMTASGLLKLIPFAGSAVNATVAGVITGGMGLFVQAQLEKHAVAKVLGEPPPPFVFDFDQFKVFLDAYRQNQKT